MNKLMGIIGMILLIVMLTAPSGSYASSTVRIDMDANTPGLQTVVTASPGDSFVSNVELVMSNSYDSLSSFGYSIQWSDTILESLLATDITTYALDSGWMDLGYYYMDSTHVYNFAQTNLNDQPNNYTSGPYTGVIASLNWTVRAPVTPTTTPTSAVTPGFIDIFDGAYNKDNNSVNLNFQGGKVELNLVPEPVSTSLFVVGAVLLCARRYFRKGR